MSNNPQRKVGIECCHGFGDGLFIAPLTKAISEQFETKVGIAVKSACADAFYNLPWVDEILPIQSMGEGEIIFNRLNYTKTFQVTPNHWFFHFKQNDNNHSLIDTAAHTGLVLGIKGFDQKPIFIPTKEETSDAEYILNTPIIALETVYNSAQSWALESDFKKIINKYEKTHKILWLSHTPPPSSPNIIYPCHLSRRSLITCLYKAEIFFSVGSGFFCASLALPTHLQPAKIVCLWTDDLYKYERRLSQEQWHTNIKWIHNSQELDGYLWQSNEEL